MYYMRLGCVTGYAYYVTGYIILDKLKDETFLIFAN